MPKKSSEPQVNTELTVPSTVGATIAFSERIASRGSAQLGRSIFQDEQSRILSFKGMRSVDERVAAFCSLTILDLSSYLELGPRAEPRSYGRRPSLEFLLPRWESFVESLQSVGSRPAGIAPGPAYQSPMRSPLAVSTVPIPSWAETPKRAGIDLERPVTAESRTLESRTTPVDSLRSIRAEAPESRPLQLRETPVDSLRPVRAAAPDSRPLQLRETPVDSLRPVRAVAAVPGGEEAYAPPVIGTGPLRGRFGLRTPVSEVPLSEEVAAAAAPRARLGRRLLSPRKIELVAATTVLASMLAARGETPSVALPGTASVAVTRAASATVTPAAAVALTPSTLMPPTPLDVARGIARAPSSAAGPAWGGPPDVPDLFLGRARGETIEPVPGPTAALRGDRPIVQPLLMAGESAPPGIALAQSIGPMAGMRRRDVDGSAGAFWPTSAALPLLAGPVDRLFPRLGMYSSQPDAAVRAGLMPRAIQQRSLLVPSIGDYEAMGQVSVVAPPIGVASPEARQRGLAVVADWRSLSKGQAPLDESGLIELRKSLPPGVRLIYPAIPLSRLPADAANLSLAQPMVSELIGRVYGSDAVVHSYPAVQHARRAVGTIPVEPVQALIAPIGRPTASSLSVMPGRPGEALAEAGFGQTRRGGVLDFVGLPVSLAPTLGAAASMGFSGSSGAPIPPTILAPDQFAALRQRAFPGVGSMVVTPDREAWSKAAPMYGIKDSSPSAIFSPAARSALPSAGGPAAHPSSVFGVDGAGPEPWRARRLHSLPFGLSTMPLSMGAPTGQPITPPLGPPIPSSEATGAPTWPRTVHSPVYYGGMSVPGLAIPAVGAHRLPPLTHLPAFRLPRWGLPPVGPTERFFDDRLTHIMPFDEPGMFGHVPAVDLQVPRPDLSLRRLGSDVGHDHPRVGEAISTIVSQTQPRLPARLPSMLYRAVQPARRLGGPAVALQRSSIGAQSQAASGQAEQQPAAGAQQDKASGSTSNEIDVLATEVWGILKNRLSMEAERSGMWGR